ncbi:uncharacterized protein LOC123510207 [Portunus trituberculatus]|uniref:uncharacterized protein LOC123510207 n=1 Tax=Portunus trituberculatus TaxID=210409 RepID=UPI001E1CE3BA|nr:uncharacterized protein LOC123510207 [Portunus trituberculatus]XP_045121056.1 uncharacterized protein LOC123510207 [Portunus trituberculatus]XP_045121057.1 uncharacterized protein LOC123510207 [Portunus trituberculatus]XP_045121058.1 uncharacterized protein LOC123510207 [Portunus trituberculatus]
MGQQNTALHHQPLRPEPRPDSPLSTGNTGILAPSGPTNRVGHDEQHPKLPSTSRTTELMLAAQDTTTHEPDSDSRLTAQDIILSGSLTTATTDEVPKKLGYTPNFNKVGDTLPCPEIL